MHCLYSAAAPAVDMTLTLTVLSQPAVHSLRAAAAGGCADTSPPAGTAGDQETAVTPMAWALLICTLG